MSSHVVCISRTVAAGGERVGRLVAERLGFRYFDDEVIQLASERAGLDPATVAKAEGPSSLLTRPIPRVFVTASPRARTQRLYLGGSLLTEEEAAQAVAESDAERRLYLERFYDVSEELPTHYDLVVNTDLLDVEQAVGAIVGAATAS